MSSTIGWHNPQPVAASVCCLTVIKRFAPSRTAFLIFLSVTCLHTQTTPSILACSNFRSLYNSRLLIISHPQQYFNTQKQNVFYI